MKNKKIFNGKIGLGNIIEFFYRYGKLVNLCLVLAILFFAGFFFYYHIFVPVKNFNQNVGIGQALLDKGAYDGVWGNFSERSEKLWGIAEKRYEDPFGQSNE